ncbi:XRE family transcriptional regulator [Bradyrhizobium tropiciagri]|uniref:XRE family transcriptional regulator n=1 Tax=Bradyrhizobium tropiciagri TaxID=312253 RepID=UPI001BAAF728|nr:XRE family transcriptional regulator [Bradyrhizobium tropiciagri]
MNSIDRCPTIRRWMVWDYALGCGPPAQPEPPTHSTAGTSSRAVAAIRIANGPISVKAKVVIEIDEAIEKLGLTQARADWIMEMPLRELTKLLRGHTEPYTVDRLKELLSRLSA